MGADPFSSTWGPFFTQDSDGTWVLSYVAYRGAPSNSSGWLENFQGTIYARRANATGDAGLDRCATPLVATSGMGESMSRRAGVRADVIVSV